MGFFDSFTEPDQPVDQEPAKLPNYLLAADNHNIGNTGDSWLSPQTWEDKLGNMGKFAAVSAISGLNSLASIPSKVSSWFSTAPSPMAGLDDTEATISALDTDLGAYYRANKEAADVVGFVATSLIPGLAGTKVFNMGQKALVAATESGMIGGNLSRATGLLVPNAERYVAASAAEINSSVAGFKLLNLNTTKAIGSGIWQNTLEAAAFETAVQATMFQSPVLDQQDWKDIVLNIGVGGAFGGVIGGAFHTAGVVGKLKSAIKEEDKARFPFVSRPSFAEASSPSERITALAYDADYSAVPVKLTGVDGTTVVNNFAVNSTLHTDKITKNFNEIREAVRKLSGTDNELGNILSNVSQPTKGAFGYAQVYHENFSGALHVSRPLSLSPTESLVNEAVKKGEVPEFNLANRFVYMAGENAGTVTHDSPILLQLADIYPTKVRVLDEVRSFGNKPGQTDWSVLNLRGPKAHLEAEARYIWARHLLKEVPAGSPVNKFDLPVLERAYKDGVFDLTLVDSTKKGALDTVKITSSRELYDAIKSAKLEAANNLLLRDTLKKTASTPVEVSTEQIAKIVNTRKSYLEGNPVSARESDDIFAHEGFQAEYLKGLEDRGLSLGVSEAKESLDFLPKVAKITYNVDQDVAVVSPAVADAMVHYKQLQRMYQDAAKNVFARVVGEPHEAFPDISDSALFNANRTGSGAGLFSSENSNYGTLGSSMAWVGSQTRELKARFRKDAADLINGPLVALGAKPQAAFEFESINQKITRSAKQWYRYSIDERGGMLHPEAAYYLDSQQAWEHYLVTRDVAKKYMDKETGQMDWDSLLAESGDDVIQIKNKETAHVFDTHRELSSERMARAGEMWAVRGKSDWKDKDVISPIRPDPRDYPFVAFVKDQRVTGQGHTTMIWAATEKELSGLIDKVPTEYQVYTKGKSEEFFKARGEYEFQRTLNENYINPDMATHGVFSNFFPKSDPNKIVNDVLQQHYRESDVLVGEAVRLRYESQFNFIEDLGKTYSSIATSKLASKTAVLEKTQDNPYFNYIKTALDISKAPEHNLIYSANKLLDEAFSKASIAIKNAWNDVKNPQDLDKINTLLDANGLKPAYYDAALHVLANHSAPRGELTKFVRNANSLLSLFTLGLDPLNALNNAVGSNILRMTELKYLTKAIKAGNTDAAGDLAGIAKIEVPGTNDQMLAPTKLVSQAIRNFWKDDGTTVARYKQLGFIKDRVEQLKLLVDDFTLKGSETVAELNQRMSGAFGKAKQLAEKGERASGNALAEEFNRFISANVMEQITDIGVKRGLLTVAESQAYINTFVNRVEGNIIASQRPLIFQGPIGQAIGLFQSYQFNLLQQLFRYSAEGSKKDLGMLLGLQSTLYGAQSLPAFQFVNTHVVGQLSGNSEHRDAYDTVYGAVGRTAGDFLLYGIASNLWIGGVNLYSRGDINPRQITVLPTSMQEIPVVAGWGKFLGSMKESVTKVASGGNVWESMLQGLEHNGISRPLAGLAQVVQGYSTSSKGSLLYSNDLMSFATLTRLAGGRPLDEAITNDALFRVKTYEAARRQDMGKLAETVKTTLMAGGQPSLEQTNTFAEAYAKNGGKQANFNKWMMGLYKNANVSQAEQLESNLKNPFAYKMQLLMGGTDD